MKDHLNVLIADDHSLVRDGLRIALERLPGLGRIDEADTAAAVRRQLADHDDTHLVILDLQMPGVSDLDLLGELCNRYPDLPVVVLSATEDSRIMHRAIEYGASGFIPKSSANDVLVNALQLVLCGGVYIPPEMLEYRNSGNRPLPGNSQYNFTDRQQDVIRLLTDGHTNKTIARELGLSEHTVKIHLSSIFKTLGVSNRTEAAIVCRELNLGKPSQSMD